VNLPVFALLHHPAPHQLTRLHSVPHPALRSPAVTTLWQRLLLQTCHVRTSYLCCRPAWGSGAGWGSWELLPPWFAPQHTCSRS